MHHVNFVNKTCRMFFFKLCVIYMSLHGVNMKCANVIFVGELKLYVFD